MTDISFRESNGRATTIKTGEVESGIVVPGVQLYAKDPTGNIVPVTADVDGNFIISIGAVTVDNVEISNDAGNPIPVSSVQIGEVQETPTSHTVLDRLKILATLLTTLLPSALGTNGGLKVDPQTPRATASATITIANSTTISSSVDLLGTALLAFIAPAAWTTSTLKIQGSTDNANWSDLYDQYGVAVSSWTALTASAAYSVDMNAMLAYRYIRFVAGTAQAANRTFTVITRPLS